MSIVISTGATRGSTVTRDESMPIARIAIRKTAM